MHGGGTPAPPARPPPQHGGARRPGTEPADEPGGGRNQGAAPRPCGRRVPPNGELAEVETHNEGKAYGFGRRSHTDGLPYVRRCANAPIDARGVKPFRNFPTGYVLKRGVPADAPIGDPTALPPPHGAGGCGACQL